LNFFLLGVVLDVFKMQKTWKNVLQSASLVLSLSLPSPLSKPFSVILPFLLGIGVISVFSSIPKNER